MTVTELLEHKWLNEGAVPDVPLDSPSIIVADEVSYCFFNSWKCCVFYILTADRSAQLVEHRTSGKRSRVQTPAGPTLRVFKLLKRKCCLCSDVCIRLDFLVFRIRTKNRRSRLTTLVPNNPWYVKEPTHCLKRLGGVVPGVVVYLYPRFNLSLTFMHGLGGWVRSK